MPFFKLVMQEQKEHAFASDKREFEKIGKEERHEWIRQMMEIPQIQGKPKHRFISHYSSTAYYDHQGTKLHYYYQKTTQLPKALLIFFHGYNNHGGTSAYYGLNISQALKTAHVFALDFQNFGKSGGDCRGFISSFEGLLAEAEGFIDHVVSQYSVRPKIFISGLSLGGAVSFQLAINKPEKYAGMILLSPGLRSLNESQAILKKIGKMVGYLFPKYKMINQSYTTTTKYNTPEIFTEDEHYYCDKLVAGSVRVVLNAFETMESQFPKLSIPYLLVQSGIDKLVDPFAPLDLEEQCKSEDKTTIYCKDMWHSVFAEEQIEDIVPIVTKWLGNRI